MKDEDDRFAVLSEKDGHDQPLLEHNLTLAQLYEEKVIPYEEGTAFFIDGVPVQKTNLKRIKITKQSSDFMDNLEELHRNVRFRVRDASIFVPIEDYPGRLVALFRESGVDVTSRVINAYQEKKNLKLPMSDLIAAASEIVVAAIRAHGGAA